jgi:hypothetical protein
VNSDPLHERAPWEQTHMAHATVLTYCVTLTLR